MTLPSASHYDLLGGEAGVRRLVDRFYDLMDTAPEAVHVRALHAASLKQSREKLFSYLSYWTGGPDTYVQVNGHPRLRARHMPFSIGARERDEWLWCMERAMSEADLTDDVRAQLWGKLTHLADFMRNQEEHP